MPSLRDVGLGFFFSGVLILLGFGILEMLKTPDTPWMIRIAFIVILVGIVIIMITLVQEQHKEVDDGVGRKY